MTSLEFDIVEIPSQVEDSTMVHRITYNQGDGNIAIYMHGLYTYIISIYFLIYKSQHGSQLKEREQGIKEEITHPNLEKF